jgi:hypothetical protein
MSKDDLVLLNQLAEDLIQTLSNDKMKIKKLNQISVL